MLKVLLATLGNPPFNVGDNEKGKEELYEGYKKTKYLLNRSSFTCLYVFDALMKLIGADSLILFGTSGSAWDKLYKNLFFYDGDSSLPCDDAVYDEQYYLQLQKAVEKNSVSRIMLEKLKTSISCCANIILLEAGMNEDEWARNLETLGAIKGADQNDRRKTEYYIDITYGFRILPIYELLSVLYFSNIDSSISIKSVLYAMSTKNFETPLVKLDPMIDLLDYTRVIREFNRYGTIHSIERIDDPESEMEKLSKDANYVLGHLSTAISFNNIEQLIKIVQMCIKIKNDTNIASAEMKLLSDHIFNTIADRFGPVINDIYAFQFELALWHFECKRYLNAVTTAEECAISFAGSVCNLPCDNFEDRNPISNALAHVQNSDRQEIIEFKKAFKNIRNLRNQLAHPVGGSQNDGNLMQGIEAHLRKIQDQYNKKFKGQYGEGNILLLNENLCAQINSNTN